MPALRIITGSRLGGARYEINRDQIYIGRDPGNDIVIQDLGVTGYHARILRTEHGYLLIEERTSTGIWVNDQRVPNLFLEHGTRFRLGQTGFRFELEDTGLRPPPWDQARTPIQEPPVPPPPVPPPPVAPPPTPDALAPTEHFELVDRVDRFNRPTREVPPAPPAPEEPIALVDRVEQPEPPGPAEVEPAEPADQVAPYDADAPAWAQAGALNQFGLSTGALLAQQGEDTCAGCGAELVGMERFCAICGARTRYGGRRRVMLLKVVALLLILGAGAAGVYTLTDGDLGRAGLARAASRVFGANVPSWIGDRLRPPSSGN